MTTESIRCPRRGDHVMDLHPTKTRLALLREVADPDGPGVWRYENEDWTTGTHRHVKLTSRIGEAAHAGWVELDRTEQPPVWRLTDAGRAVLDAAS